MLSRLVLQSARRTRAHDFNRRFPGNHFFNRHKSTLLHSNKHFGPTLVFGGAAARQPNARVNADLLPKFLARRAFSTSPPPPSSTVTPSATAAEAATRIATASAETAAKLLEVMRKQRTLFRNLFVLTSAGSVIGGYSFFYWYTQGRHEAKLQKAVIDPNLVDKLDDMKPADTAMHPYSSRSWLWKVLFIALRAVKLVWIWLPVMLVAPISVLSGNEELRAYLVRLLVRTTKRAGCSFVKFGQWVSMRPDIFAADIVDAMKQLMTDAPAHSYLETRRIIRESFGINIEDLFETFEEHPVASGSVAQVHKATLRPHQSPSGKPIQVAVKVLHPATLDETYIDIQIMTYVCANLRTTIVGE